ncbi:MAG: LacI family DNA-binding transcriptional regulator [Aeromicrobium sp.]
MSVAQVRDVAARAGVSPATVSNAMNHPEKVSAATLERIQAAIVELGFVRNDAARQLRAGTNRAVGMIVLDVANPFFTDVARGVEDQLAETSRPLLLGNSGQDAARESSYLDLFEEQRVAGILISPVGNVLDRLRRLHARGAAVVLVDRKSGASEFSSVSVDDRLGGRMAAEHLIERGRRRIAVIGGPGRLRQVKHRLEGAQQVAAEHSKVSVEFVDTGAMFVESGRTAMTELLSRPKRERPDAVFATNDLVALGALQALAAAGVSVPDDVALVGYDDIEFAASATIPITSVRQPSRELGEAAAELLLAAIEDHDAPVRHPVFTPELVARASS